MHIPGAISGRGRCAVVTLAAVLCTAMHSGAFAPTHTPPEHSLAGGPVPPPVNGPSLDWKPCPGAPGFECAAASVPLDHRAPGGRAIELAVIKRKATDPGHRVGTLFYNPGGPGSSGTEDLPLSYELFPEEIRRRFDIVSWDPRGVGSSTAVRCFDSPQEAYEWAARNAGGFPVGAQEREVWFDGYTDLARRCEKRDPELLRHVSTADTARDLDRLREAVGEQRLSYFGVSYGTLLGATYANLFPGRVRAMVLDANIDPEAWFDHGTKIEPPLTMFQRTDADLGAAATLRQFLDLCGRTDTEHCAFSAGSPSATRAKYEQLLRRLERRPESEGVEQEGWTYAVTVGTTFEHLYTVDPSWTELAEVLEDLWQGRTPDEPPSPPAPVPYPGFEQIEAIRCSESPNPRDPLRYPSLADFGYRRAGDLGRLIPWSTSACAVWPASAADPYRGPWNRPTAPLLVVNSTFDPVTPHQGAVAMTRELANAHLLTIKGYGHSALTNVSLCADEYESRYLIDGTLPPAGTACTQDIPPFAPVNPIEPEGGLDTGGGGLAKGDRVPSRAGAATG
ncbi:alpha/beta hydrolase [Streptomyces sp. SCSIO 30461]|uniref:alpha/beta hydrolase n=1 Tax=Streptomyces sp. SCSIO 30461 TaxID=3118085 RepID=UPI0030CD7CE7